VRPVVYVFSSMPEFLIWRLCISADGQPVPMGLEATFKVTWTSATVLVQVHHADHIEAGKGGVTHANIKCVKLLNSGRADDRGR
jgi:hypothetical protein